ncbi:hypothetical protein FHT40_005805 [Mycolicibacterium sp. BK556]|uniref:hypothetical protein n=1 Tax=Mycobacteriaceae TaxID=1762 RepID=UPI0010601632|nr:MULTISPECIES: hypothetical protein [Mycobacteriaceae]MBB3606116.1 hypothetical protein [Mycolicibacterium sp. BK556]MBB3632693.1 hypothetical protein [Mycolicibacterium sp. BK607]MBB3754042.1 hypothetical protein [Mycolicibacterium sp. BK634]TDO17982.1 hypothetical protein EV580_1161 [Mycobacterium sp. BK086]
MRKLIVGSQARQTRAVTEYELRHRYVRMHRDVYVPKGYSPDLVDVIDGAWLRSGRRGVVAGIAASALHGASWVDDDLVVELIWNNTRPPKGIIARAERLEPDEMTTRQCIAVTTAARTAYDLGRHLPRLEALVRLDALKRATSFSNDDVLGLARRYKGARGTRQLLELLPIVDGGAASPQETRLRLLYLDAGFPRPVTQVAVFKRGWEVLRTLDMGWEEFKVASEYDGDQHRTNRVQYVKDQRLMPKVAQLGWDVIRVIKEDSDADTLNRTFAALIARGWDGQLRPTRKNRWWRPPPVLGRAASL